MEWEHTPKKKWKNKIDERREKTTNRIKSRWKENTPCTQQFFNWMRCCVRVCVSMNTKEIGTRLYRLFGMQIKVSLVVSTAKARRKKQQQPKHCCARHTNRGILLLLFAVTNPGVRLCCVLPILSAHTQKIAHFDWFNLWSVCSISEFRSSFFVVVAVVHHHRHHVCRCVPAAAAAVCIFIYHVHVVQMNPFSEYNAAINEQMKWEWTTKKQATTNNR